MAHFAGTPVLQLEGNPNGPKIVLREHDRIGIDGVTYEYTRRQANSFTLRVMSDVGNAALGNQFLRDLESNVGQFCTFELSNGQTFTNMILLEVVPGPIRATGPYIGGVYNNSTMIVSADLLMRYPYGFA